MAGPNFPDSPKPGTTYEYAGIVYTFVVVQQVTPPDLGYWKANFDDENLPLNRDLLDLPRFPVEIDYNPLSYHYRVLKSDPNGTVKVSNHNFIMSPLGVFVTDPDLTQVGEYYIFGEDTIFEGSDANWQFTNTNVREDVMTMKDFLKDCPNYTGDDEIVNWKPNNVETFESAFENASSFNADLSGWATGSADNMELMFKGASSFDQDISDWCVRLIPSRPTEFDIGSGFDGEFDKHPGWGECPRNEDGGNFIGNVTVEGPDAVIIDTDEPYTWSNDGNYQPGQYTTFREKWEFRGETVTNPIFFGAPGGYEDLKVIVSSPYATDSPVTGVKSVYVDGTLSSLTIDGPSLTTANVKSTYTINDAGTGAGRNTYTWKVTMKDGTEPQPGAAFIDLSEDTRTANIYFIEGGPAPNYYEFDVVATPNTDQDIEGRKPVLVEDSSTSSFFDILGPDTAGFHTQEEYELVIDPSITVLNIYASVNAPNLIEHTDGDKKCTVNFLVDPTDEEVEAVITYSILTYAGTQFVSKTVKLGCVNPKVVELRTSTFTDNKNLIIGGWPGTPIPNWLQHPEYVTGNNFDPADIEDPCTQCVLIVDSDVYGDILPNYTAISTETYSWPAITVYAPNGWPGGLTIRVEPGVKVIGGPGVGAWQNNTGLFGPNTHDDPDDFENNPKHSMRCWGDEFVPNSYRNAGDGRAGIWIESAEPSSITIENAGDIGGGGGGGGTGYPGQPAALTECFRGGSEDRACTRGGYGGRGGCGQGGVDFIAVGADDDHYWDAKPPFLPYGIEDIDYPGHGGGGAGSGPGSNSTSKSWSFPSHGWRGQGYTATMFQNITNCDSISVSTSYSWSRQGVPNWTEIRIETMSGGLVRSSGDFDGKSSHDRNGSVSTSAGVSRTGTYRIVIKTTYSNLFDQKDASVSGTCNLTMSWTSRTSAIPVYSGPHSGAGGHGGTGGAWGQPGNSGERGGDGKNSAGLIGCDNQMNYLEFQRPGKGGPAYSITGLADITYVDNGGTLHGDVTTTRSLEESESQLLQFRQYVSDEKMTLSEIREYVKTVPDNLKEKIRNSDLSFLFMKEFTRKYIGSPCGCSDFI